MHPDFRIRKAESKDSQKIHSLIKELAVFEKAPDEVINTSAAIELHGWSEMPLFQAWVAEVEQEIVGMALCYVRYSTWKGPVLYLEDLIVTETHRGKGIGKALFEQCIAYSREQGYVRMCWQVLDWNEQAIEFYAKYGATFDAEWLNCNLDIQNESLE